MTTDELKADCYSAGERDWMLATQRWREQALAPLLRSLVSVQVTPNGLTLLSLLAGLAFCPLWLVSKPAAMVTLLVHVLLDGLDGRWPALRTSPPAGDRLPIRWPTRLS